VTANLGLRERSVFHTLGRWIALSRPPIDRPQFWIVQALVVSIAAGHGANEWLGIVYLHGADFVPVTLFLIPVVYAALTFGTRGAALTSMWAFVLTLPNVVFWHEGAAAWGELWQSTVVVGVGLFVGRRVDGERQARSEAETRERQRRASEERFRGLFEMTADAILLLDEHGRVIEANAAALALLGFDRLRPRGRKLDDLNTEIGRAIRQADSGVAPPLLIDQTASRKWVEAVSVSFTDADGEPRVLAQLRDVTLAVERQQLVEGFARRTVSAREEERRRIARDLHDGPIQSLMLLWRGFDVVDEPRCTDGHRMLHEGRKSVEAIADELRRFSRGLRPSVLDDLGLAPALKAEADRLGGRCGIEVTFTLDADRTRMPPELELTLFRIGQEALRNIERHAGARRVGVTLELGSETYRMQIGDDGIGARACAPADLVSSGRLGLVGMQERAKSIGATCSIGATPAWSTLVDVAGSYESAS
jgi:PAS domain S-box-containing protein